MEYFSYTDKREVLQQEYSQSPILPCPPFRWVVKLTCLEAIISSQNVCGHPENLSED